MSDNGLKPGEILCPSQRVKYHRIEYHEGYVIIEGHTPEKMLTSLAKALLLNK